MKWYFASRTKHKDFINKIINFIKLNNHSVVYDWSKLENLEPYNENSEKSSNIAMEISKELKNVDIFVLISDENGTDMFIELGIVIGNWLQNEKIRIYSVGKFNDRSLMHHHPAIKRVNNLKKVFSIECPELLNKKEFSDIINSFDIL